MTPNGIFQILIYFALIVAVTKPMGVYMTRVFSGERTFLHPLLRPLERLCYRSRACARMSSNAGHSTRAACFRSASSASCWPICFSGCKASCR